MTGTGKGPPQEEEGEAVAVGTLCEALSTAIGYSRLVQSSAHSCLVRVCPLTDLTTHIQTNSPYTSIVNSSSPVIKF